MNGCHVPWGIAPGYGTGPCNTAPVRWSFPSMTVTVMIISKDRTNTEIYVLEIASTRIKRQSALKREQFFTFSAQHWVKDMTRIIWYWVQFISGLQRYSSGSDISSWPWTWCPLSPFPFVTPPSALTSWPQSPPSGSSFLHTTGPSPSTGSSRRSRYTTWLKNLC